MILESSVYVFQCLSYFYVYNYVLLLWWCSPFWQFFSGAAAAKWFVKQNKTLDVSLSSNSEWYKDFSQIGLFLRIVLLTTKDSMMAMEIVIIVKTYASIVEDLRYVCISTSLNHYQWKRLYRKFCKTTRRFSGFSGIAVLAFVIDILLNCGLTIGNTLSDGFSLWYSCILLSLFASSYVITAANSRKVTL